jgi:small subunit ribosomal protein S20
VPNKKSAEKRVLLTERNRVRNSQYKASIRTALKKARGLGQAGSTTDAMEAFKQAQSLIDRAVLKGIVPKNKGARDKSRLMLAIKKQDAASAN